MNEQQTSTFDVTIDPLDEDRESFISINIRDDYGLRFEADGVLRKDELAELIRRMQVRLAEI